MANVVIAEELRPLLEDQRLEGHEVSWLSPKAPMPGGAYEAIITLLSRAIGSRELDAAPNLRVVANCAVGVDNIDVEAAHTRGVIVTNTPDVLTEATADLTWALILAATRRLKEGAELVAQGRWEGWHPTQLLGIELNRATLGIIGAGRIGQAVGRRAVPFGMRLLYHARTRKTGFEQDTGAERAALDELLAASEVVSLHVPSTERTRGMIGRAEFARMAPGSVFINTARGDLVDETALIDALDAGRIAGAGLDVFANEPAVPKRLVGHPRVVTLPHLGSATTTTRRAMAELALANVRSILSGGDAITPVAD